MDDFYIKSMHTLELDKILSRLSDMCVSEGAKKRAIELVPMESLREINRAQDETAAAISLATKKGSPSFYGVRDLKPQLMRAGRGGVLTMGEILWVGAMLRAARLAHDYRMHDTDTGETCKAAADQRGEDDVFRNADATASRESDEISGLSQ